MRLPISPGSPRTSEPKWYLECLPDILDAEEVAEFLDISHDAVRAI